ncbi:MAG: hypothetical protein KDK07_00765 [Bauldia sp.]|nr:hypothetical protein [Bauldia sp.]
MKAMFAAACVAAALLASPAGAAPAPDRPVIDEGTVFDELSALGFDLGKFHPDYAGRFPYR